MAHLLACLSLVLGTLLVPVRTRADAQVSIRNTLELGQRSESDVRAFVYGFGVRGDATYGAAHARAFRVGPAFELRTLEFKTAEAALGASILIPMPGDAPIGLSGLVGHATRTGAPDGLVGVGTVSWGFRGYNYHSWYGYALNLFFTGRKHLGGEQLIEFTGGIEIDVAFTTLIPGAAIVRFLRDGDPYED